MRTQKVGLRISQKEKEKSKAKAAVRLEQVNIKKTNIGATRSANNGPASVLSPDKCFAQPSGTLTHGGARGAFTLFVRTGDAGR